MFTLVVGGLVGLSCPPFLRPVVERPQVLPRQGRAQSVIFTSLFVFGQDQESFRFLSQFLLLKRQA